MNEVNRDLVMGYYSEIYTNLHIEKNDQVIKMLDNFVKENPTITYVELIASLKIYLLSIIESMFKNQLTAQEKPVGEQSESKTE